MSTYRKKPVVVEAIRWDGTQESLDAILELAFRDGNQLPSDGVHVTPCIGWVATGALEIPTLEGVMAAMPGDWIIRGVAGELYPCKPDIFERTYEPA